ncbi:MAG: NAD-dependent epimerase/dehydratase family protein [Candidatus Xiphinematobacter sp.]|nr:MAG: NAD-dependent epimerase/dehydratase family protein [Candidatus Xiphinematobacter sp.]
MVLAVPRALIIGCGFIGEVVADLLFQMGWEVCATCRSDLSAGRLSHKPYPIRACDVVQGTSLQLFSELQLDAVFFCASSRGGGAEAYQALYLQGSCNVSKVLRPKKILFASSTSLYAQEDGEIVDEQSPAEPKHLAGKILLEAENAILRTGGTVARLAGIYGPARSVLMKRFLTGQARLEGDGQRWINQIHREDAARALVCLLHAPEGIYNVCDCRPARQCEIYQWLADFFQMPLPREGHENLERKRGHSNKRVSNQKLRDRQWVPHWMSYRDAIPSIASTLVEVQEDYSSSEKVL